ncbi:P-loop containing nucleoside triphosphate hydrolase protein, partial [Blastocladiella britannica]
GKSTATGHLVFKCGAVDPQILAHFEARAAAAVHSTTLAWLTDQLQAARDAGLPLDMHPDAARFATSKYAVQVIDVPGHRDFVKNMVTGASRADLAILVVSAVEHEFAHGMGTTTTSSATAPSSQSSALTGGGETVEHAMLAHTLGVRQIIVAVNKMDAVGYSHDRYASVVAETSAMLKRLGYNPKTVSYVPISGRTGDGLVEASADPRMAWFTGWRKDGKAGEKTGMPHFSLIFRFGDF